MPTLYNDTMKELERLHRLTKAIALEVSNAKKEDGYLKSLIKRARSNGIEKRDALRILLFAVNKIFPAVVEEIAETTPTEITIMINGEKAILSKKDYGAEKIAYILKHGNGEYIFKIFKDSFQKKSQDFLARINKFSNERSFIAEYFGDELVAEKVEMYEISYRGFETVVPVIVSEYYENFVDPLSFETPESLIEYLLQINYQEEFLSFINKLLNFYKKTDRYLDICGKNNFVITTHTQQPEIKILDTNGSHDKNVENYEWFIGKFDFLMRTKDLLERLLAKES